MKTTIFYLEKHVRQILNVIDQAHLAKQKCSSPDVVNTLNNTIGDLKDELVLMHSLIKELKSKSDGT